MSLAGLRKQINKANQYVSERVGTAEPTKLDDEYLELEKKVDGTSELVEELMNKTREYLQPNPVTRAKMTTGTAISKIRGTNKSMPYPQPEGTLGEVMTKYGRTLREGPQFGSYEVLGKALCDAGEAFHQMAEVKYAMEDNVKQNFLDPLYQMQQKDLKECSYHRKKVVGRRLDYDCKRRKQGTTGEELHQAEEKLEESKRLAESAMHALPIVEQISQLCALVSAQLDFHKQTVDVLQGLQHMLKDRVNEASSLPKHQYVPKPVVQPNLSPSKKSPMDDERSPMHSISSSQQHSANGQSHWPATTAQDPWDVRPTSNNSMMSSTPAATGGASQQQRNKACAKAVFDFDAENEGELGFKEGQIITLTSQIDENWFEGCLPNGKAGFFPISYVDVLVPL